MPKPEEIAAVVALGQRYETWESITIESQFGVANDGISRVMTLRVAEIGDINHGFKTLRLKPGDQAQGFLAGRQVISGTVTARQARYDAQRHGVEIIVISRSQNTIPSTVDASPGQYDNYTIEQIAKAVFGKVGVGFRIEGSPPGADKIFPRVNEHPGESRFGFIERLCRFRNLFMRDDENGDIIATRGGPPGRGPVAQLREGNNILQAGIVMRNDEAVDQIDILLQAPGNDQVWGDDARAISGTAKVNGLPVDSRRKVRDVGEQPGDQLDAQMRAKHEAAINSLQQLEADIVVPGWLMDDGSLWIEHLGQNVTILSPMLLPMDWVTLKLKSVKHLQDSETGTRTELRLCLPSGLGADAEQVDMSFPGSSQ